MNKLLLKMNKLLLMCAIGIAELGIAACLMGRPALAGDKTLEEIDKEDGRIFYHDGVREQKLTRFVISGKEQRIYFLAHLNTDCSVDGETVVRITKDPEHGKLKAVPGMEYVSFRKDNPRYKCREHKVKGTQLLYTSEDKFTGKDTAEAVAIFPGGYAWEIHIDVTVR